VARMRSIYDLPTPALLLDLDVLEDNLRSMQQRTEQLSVALRPHLKTHKCVEIAMAQRELGCSGVTVSTLYEANVFADHGFDDITWAFPMPPARAQDVAGMGERVRFGVVVDSRPPIESLVRAGARVRVWIKIDCGYGRAGIRPEDPALVPLAASIEESPSLEFGGILSHSGNAYAAKSPMDARRIGAIERSRMVETVDRLREAGFDVPAVSTGSTPTMAHVASLEGVTEVRPGNYSLYDYTQVALGSCSAGSAAATVLATVVSPSGPDRSVIDAGALAMSLDRGPAHGARAGFGRLYADYSRGLLRHNARIVSLSQEHGILDQSLAVGERVRILPNHSCLTVACFDTFQVVRGEEVLDCWKIWRGR
jgi:D-serine deaminase-like pyridoxal phosphate-dependent protein